MPAFLSPIVGWFAKNAILSSLTAFIGPLITGIFKLGGGIFTAIAEIIMALSKSPEGRVMLAVAALACAGLYGRWHYLEQGRADAKTAFARQAACASPTSSRKSIQPS